MSDTRPRILALSPSLATRARGVLHRASILATGDDAIVLDVLGTMVELSLGHDDEERMALLHELLVACAPAAEASQTTARGEA